MIREQVWGEWERLKPKILQTKAELRKETNEKFEIIRKIMDLRSVLDTVKRKTEALFIWTNSSAPAHRDLNEIITLVNNALEDNYGGNE